MSIALNPTALAILSIQGRVFSRIEWTCACRACLYHMLLSVKPRVACDPPLVLQQFRTDPSTFFDYYTVKFLIDFILFSLVSESMCVMILSIRPLWLDTSLLPAVSTSQACYIVASFQNLGASWLLSMLCMMQLFLTWRASSICSSLRVLGKHIFQ